jgi:aspartyl-tRNA(Asn)/glutamyl-tRNA(Gln) amidotransferase subunit C
MTLTDSDVRHVARLARLGLADDEVGRLRVELTTILDHVAAIAELDLAGVTPTCHPLDLVNILAADEPAACLTQSEALANAPDPAGGGFRVPTIGS